LGDRTAVKGPDGEEVFAHALPTEGQGASWKFPPHGPGGNRSRSFVKKTVFALSVPLNVPLSIRWFTFDGDGKPAKHEPNGRIVIFDVPPGQGGRVWAFQSFKGWEPIRMLNLPAMLSFFPNTLMVPENVAPLP